MATSHGRLLRGLRVHLPLLLVFALVVIGLVQIVLYYWRQGSGFVGLALLAAAGLRAVLSTDQAGLLAIRGKGVDVLSYTALAALILFVVVTIEGGPFD